MLRELIPGDLFKVQNSAEWKRTIVAMYNQDTGIICFIYFNDKVTSRYIWC